MKNINSIMAVIISFIMFLQTACGSDSEGGSIVTAQSENTGIAVTESEPQHLLIIRTNYHKKVFEI